jgi:hypothetical protein
LAILGGRAFDVWAAPDIKMPNLSKWIHDLQGTNPLTVLQIFGKKHIRCACQCRGNNQTVIISEAKSPVNCRCLREDSLTW